MDAAAIASAVIDSWKPPSKVTGYTISEALLPGRPVIEKLLAISFEASLLREENRPLNFRIILRDPDRFAPTAGPPDGLHRLIFDKPRPFTAHELRRLTPAVDYDRSLVGVCLDNRTEQMQIWGIVQSGSRWLEQFHGGRGNPIEFPDSLIIGVSAPGYLTVSQGSRPLCAIEAGALHTDRLNVFKSRWLPESFASIREELIQLHNAERAASGAPWAVVDAKLTRIIAQQMIQRLISTVQRSWHGGTLVIIPPHRAQEFAQTNDWVNVKYAFKGDEAPARFRSLILGVMRTLAKWGANDTQGAKSVGWDDYGRIRDRELTDLDEAIFELAHLMATLSQVDGAVVVTKRFELIGFAAEIAGTLPEVREVARALDLEGDSYCVEAIEGVGTRHRSVYRLCNALHDVLGIVVSQDGGARFVGWKDEHVMYWHHTTIAHS